MRSIAELLEITSEIVLWKDRRLWWINQCWLAGTLITLNLGSGVVWLVAGRYLTAAIAMVALLIALVVLIRAIQGIKCADYVIAKLKESAVAP